MTPRIQNHLKYIPEGFKALMSVSAAVKASGIEPRTLELAKVRASQINGCAACLYMHTTEAREAGETEMRLYMLSAWRDSPLFTDRERAALAWTEALTLLADRHAPDEDYDMLKAQFTEAEQVQLTLAIGLINLWNRLQVGVRAVHPVEWA